MMLFCFVFLCFLCVVMLRCVLDAESVLVCCQWCQLLYSVLKLAVLMFL